VKTKVGIEWATETVDTFKAGDPKTIVTGIITTPLVSLDVLKTAVKSGANLIVTCEPTFFAKADSSTPPVRRLPGSPLPSSVVPPPADPVFAAKDDFIRRHKLVIWKFSDRWRQHKPDAFVQGLASTLGWSNFAEVAGSNLFALRNTSLNELAERVKRSLRARGGVRVIGDPHLQIRKVALIPGTSAIQTAIKSLPEVDAIVAGEVREWESVEYVRDTVDLGGRKSLILVGRMLSEGPGMRLCAEWLKAIVPEVSSTSILIGGPGHEPTYGSRGCLSRIKSNLGFAWRTNTYRDTYKFGGPETQVKGIATTMFCTYDVVRRAAELGCNLIIPHEDTYWMTLTSQRSSARIRATNRRSAL